MRLNTTIPPESERNWSAFLNGEPETSVVSNLEVIENAESTAAWEAAGNQFSYCSANPDQAWLNLQKEVFQQDKKMKMKFLVSRVLKYAAMLIMVIGIGFATYRVVKVPEKQPGIFVVTTVAETEAHPLSVTFITFPDGSTARMNASTRIEYLSTFNQKVRRVQLSGEAFFEVTRDTARPFVIETNHASVEVLGTSFNVAAYPKSGLVEVNVRTGKVKLVQRLEGLPEKKSLLLPAGERGWLKVAESEMGQSALNPNYASWFSKQIIFQRTRLSDAFALLENTYHVKIGAENSEIEKIPYTANFADQKLDSIIKKIALTHKLGVKRKGDEVIFFRKDN